MSGLTVVNDARTTQIDENYVGYTLHRSESVVFSTSCTIYLKPEDILVLRGSDSQYPEYMAVSTRDQTSAKIFRSSRGVPTNTSALVHFDIYTKVVGSTNYGLQVFNPSGELVFNATSKMAVISGITSRQVPTQLNSLQQIPIAIGSGVVLTTGKTGRVSRVSDFGGRIRGFSLDAFAIKDGMAYVRHAILPDFYNNWGSYTVEGDADVPFPILTIK